MSNPTTSTKSDLNLTTSSTFNATSPSPLSRNSTALTVVTSSIHVS
ncbi:hypothetical protein A2U01_0021043, partial [Trifolium medium]|nr:hypothetical protein [Trifolium medium]